MGVKLNYVDAQAAEVNNRDEAPLRCLWTSEASAMVDRIEAYQVWSFWRKRAAVPRESSDTQRYVRGLFWVGRNMGVFGLPHHAARTVELARASSTQRKLGIMVFDLAVSVSGWRSAASLVEMRRHSDCRHFDERSADA